MCRFKSLLHLATWLHLAHCRFNSSSSIHNLLGSSSPSLSIPCARSVLWYILFIAADRLSSSPAVCSSVDTVQHMLHNYSNSTDILNVCGCICMYVSVSSSLNFVFATKKVLRQVTSHKYIFLTEQAIFTYTSESFNQQHPELSRKSFKTINKIIINTNQF